MILLINPRATQWRFRVPLSILSIGASLEGAYDYEILDGNIDAHLHETVLRRLRQGDVTVIGITVMPGPQLGESIVLSRRVRKAFPRVTIVWGGYFPTLHTDVTLASPNVDFVIRDQGDYAFRRLVDILMTGGSFSTVNGLSYKDGTRIIHNQPQQLLDPNELPPLPYHRVPMPMYIGRTYVGSRTINYHSSVGCPFLCGFCAVAAIYQARWIGLTPERISHDLLSFRKDHGVNAVEFHDNNFFTSERRTREFAERMLGKGFTWWGEARPDTMLRYDDSTWRIMKDAGSKMIFFGAESGSAEVLQLMEKGGTQTPDTVLTLAEKMRTFGIIPEFSFVLGNPTGTVAADVENDILFIRKVKAINPEAEIIIYIYSPVHFEGSVLFQQAKQLGFAYPQSLDDWMLPQWSLHDLRKNPVTPWITANIRGGIKNFERVLNAAYPTLSDLHLSGTQRSIMKLLGSWRYRLKFYQAPYEIAGAQRLFRYRQPEIEGF